MDTSLGGARRLGDPICFTSLRVGPVGWLSVPEGRPVSGGCWLPLGMRIRVFTPEGLTEGRQVHVLVCLPVGHMCALGWLCESASRHRRGSVCVR